MNGLAVWPLLIPVAGLLMLLAAWWLFRMGREVQAERARESFRLQHERLTEVFLKAAAQTGKPRGLRWVSCTFTGAFVLVREIQSRKLAALVPAILQFEPLPDGDMLDVPAATQPRPATVVFHFRKGEWISEGRALFNLNPEQALALFAKEYEPLDPIARGERFQASP
jgi:hypothetical protein